TIIFGAIATRGKKLPAAVHMDRCGFRRRAPWRFRQYGPLCKSLRLIVDPLQRDAGEPRKTEGAATGGREIDHSSARIKAPISDRKNNTLPNCRDWPPHLASQTPPPLPRG